MSEPPPTGDPAANSPPSCDAPFDGRSIVLSQSPGGLLRLTRPGDRCYLRVKVVRAAPLSAPDYFVGFLDAKGKEICTIESLSELDPPSRDLASAALAQLYSVARITRIASLRVEMGITYWEVDTDRGSRAFTLKDIGENIRELGPGRLLLIDTHGNRYEIPDQHALDLSSQRILSIIL